MSKRKIETLKGHELQTLRDGIASGCVSYSHLADELGLRVKDVQKYAEEHEDSIDADLDEKMIVLTRENLHALGTNGAGFNNAQLEILGVLIPPRKGWLSRLIGRELPEATYYKVLSLKAATAPKVEPELTPRQQKAQAQFEFREELQQTRFRESSKAAAEILAPLAGLLADGRGGWSDMLAAGMKGGAVPAGRDAIGACVILLKVRPELTEDGIYTVFEKAREAAFRVLKGIK